MKFEISPLPWGAWDKHAQLYDAEGKGIASFNTDPENWPPENGGSKKAVDLTNRNRVAQCVNAMKDIDEPFYLMEIAKQVAEGNLPPDALKKLFTERKEEDSKVAQHRKDWINHICGILAGTFRVIGGLPSEQFEEQLLKVKDSATDLYVRAADAHEAEYGPIFEEDDDD